MNCLASDGREEPCNICDSCRAFNEGRALDLSEIDAASNRGIDEIRDLLNRDLAAHGEVQGLPSNYLVAELERLGVALAHSARPKRFLSNAKYFSESLALSPDGGVAVEAAFRLLQGAFYDSFDSDPLESTESWQDLRAQIELAEKLSEQDLAGERREEADFILAVRYVRAARRAPGPGLAGGYARKARTALVAFEKRYPASLRAAAVLFLIDALETAK